MSSTRIKKALESASSTIVKVMSEAFHNLGYGAASISQNGQLTAEEEDNQYVVSPPVFLPVHHQGSQPLHHEEHPQEGIFLA